MSWKPVLANLMLLHREVKSSDSYLTTQKCELLLRFFFP